MAEAVRVAWRAAFTAVEAWARGEPARMAILLGDRGGLRLALHDWLDWEDAWREYAGRRDFLVTVEPERNLRAGRVSRIVLDVDAHDDPAKGAERFATLTRALRDAGLEWWALHTGGGWHVYLELGEPVRVPWFRDAVRALLEEVLGGDPSRVVDLHPVRHGQLGRPPCSLNRKWETLVRLHGVERGCWEDGFTPPVNRGLGEWLLEKAVAEGGGREYTGEVERSVFYAPSKRRGYREWPACIREMVRTLAETGELEHLARVHLGSFLLRTGVDPHRVFALADDYREWKTQYHLEYIKRRGIYTLSCKRVAELGYCPYWRQGGRAEARRRCPFYPWVERFIEPWDSEGVSVE